MIPSIYRVRIIRLLLRDLPLAVFQPAKEAALVTFVTNSGAKRLHSHQYRVSVTVGRNLLDHQTVARTFALKPQFLPRTAKKSRIAGLHGLAECLFVHVSHHEDAPRGVVLDDGCHQSSSFVKIRSYLNSRSDTTAFQAVNLKLVLFYTLITRLIVTGGGIRREDLNGVRTRAQVRHPRRGVLHSWGFSQLRQMIAYKAVLAGVLVELVDPHNTSRMCSKCGHCEKGNRGNQSEFRCRSCGREAHADINAAENIRQGRSKPAERDVVENRLSHSYRFRRLSAAVTSPRL